MTATLRLLSATAAIVLLLGTGVAFAADPHSGGSTGRPDQTCQDLGDPIPSPGNSANAPGSPFNENGGVAGGKYAGSQPQNSNNGQASQYDVACLQQTQH